MLIVKCACWTIRQLRCTTSVGARCKYVFCRTSSIGLGLYDTRRSIPMEASLEAGYVGAYGGNSHRSRSSPPASPIVWLRDAAYHKN